MFSTMPNRDQSSVNTTYYHHHYCLHCYFVVQVGMTLTS